MTDAGSHQVWPWAGESEQCSPPQASVLQPGSTETLRAAWNQQVMSSNGTAQQAPDGTYNVVGTWTWNAGNGQPPFQAAVRSDPFAIA
ncbi:MAG: hypothetical protein ACYDD6_06795 [Acidimicrobiales bacterium]